VLPSVAVHPRAGLRLGRKPCASPRRTGVGGLNGAPVTETRGAAHPIPYGLKVAHSNTPPAMFPGWGRNSTVTFLLPRVISGGIGVSTSKNSPG